MNNEGDINYKPKLSTKKREELKLKLSEIEERNKYKQRRSFQQHRRQRAAKPARIEAYDFETDRIKAGTPRPLYLTAYGENFSIETPIKNLAHLAEILITYFLTEEKRGTKYVAWNGNRFDAYFVAAAMLGNPEYIIRPYLTASHNVRGLRISLVSDDPKAKAWEFLDGIAMLGLEGVSLEKLLNNFAPEYKKLVDAIDFEKEDFDYTNSKHCDYAMRDSVGLYHAMIRAQNILLESFNQPLTVTMGGACIKIFQSYIPRDVIIKALDHSCERVFREFVMRGGFCYCFKRYRGPIWKYDINQAYAAAMRESELPCGSVLYRQTGIPTEDIFIAQVSARHPTNIVPFYYRTEINGRIRSVFHANEISDTWLTSIEIEQLRSEGWRITWGESYSWAEGFTMQEYVDKLERLRTTCEGGPSGPIGTMVKAVGNHSYGKTVEQIPPFEFLLSFEQPDGYFEYYDENNDLMQNVWFRFQESGNEKEYHAVQIGAFITAAVRMKVRQAALINPQAWLYADTDCVIFNENVTSEMDIDPKRYGAWKIEETGTIFQIIAKKVYSEVASKPKKKSAKGMNVNKLSGEDFDKWFEGQPPEQLQTQRNNFLIVMQGAQMFRSQLRKGTRV